VPVAREGLPFVGVGATATLVAFLIGFPWFGLLGIAATMYLASFFRDPARTPPPGDSVVAPADGRIVKVGPVEDHRFLRGPAQQVSIFMSPLNVHVNRNPVSGRVLEVRYNHGRYFRAFADKASLDNEQNAVVVEDPRGRRLAFVQIAGFLARRIVCYLKPGMMVERAERCGMIMFGSRVDIFLPPDAALRVAIGQRTRAGETVVAEWPT
jgi:phosphatidylserine decarboxylase